MKTTLLTFLSIMGFAFLVAIASPSTSYAQEAAVDSESSESIEVTNDESKTTEQATSDTDATYSYIAQPGDSYTVLARKAIQIYGINNDVNLSGAQIVFAETNLTLEAGSPILNEGQKVDFSDEHVKNWVEKASKLSDAEQAAWEYYVPYVNFNTNKNGE